MTSLKDFGIISVLETRGAKEKEFKWLILSGRWAREFFREFDL
ncbi:hypothetical protein NitYY0814_C0489 [Nitratiruptor sp. YY08-14]|nr:hypothetical protein NitYY0810_C0489 [Nitratiruptor sp. YY08-10]BCD63661.1 hypothetical protein NitYY0814_C0489 [Nitratiruptor sp. YY08-14]